MNIEKAGKTAKEFLERNLGHNARVIKMVKGEEGWKGEAEIYEESSFIKALGLPAKVQDRNVYEVILTNDLEVVAYKQKKDTDEEK